MAKTRILSTTLISIKQEEKESKTELENDKPLNGVSTTTKTTGKIIGKKIPKNIKNISFVSGIKIEEDESIRKALLQAKKYKTKTKITQDHIKQLIYYVENDRMSIRAAASKLGISQSTGTQYYNIFKNDPERKIPEPLKGKTKDTKYVTQDQVTALITHVVKDEIPLKAAALKTQMSLSTAYSYYMIYLEDPERKIPKVFQRSLDNSKPCTQDQLQALIDLVVNNKMSISAASRKVHLPNATARRYFARYFNDPNRRIPTPNKLGSKGGIRISQEKLDLFICCIVNDKMTIPAASLKAKISTPTGRKYYKEYLESLNNTTL